MKGIFEEYGTVVIAVIVSVIFLGFLLPSAFSPRGSIHKFVVVNMENMGAKTQTVLNEWNIGGITVTFKDDGILYLTGSGTLPSYSSIEETPWVSEKGHIDRVSVVDTVIVNGKVPIN